MLDFATKKSFAAGKGATSFVAPTARTWNYRPSDASRFEFGQTPPHRAAQGTTHLVRPLLLHHHVSLGDPLCQHRHL